LEVETGREHRNNSAEKGNVSLKEKPHLTEYHGIKKIYNHKIVSFLFFRMQYFSVLKAMLMLQLGLVLQPQFTKSCLLGPNKALPTTLILKTSLENKKALTY
jgi:hypothetical protein